jgi:hypothetical protein
MPGVNAVRAVTGELDVEYSSLEQFAQIALEWLTDGVSFLAGDISDEILTGPPLTRTYAASIDEEDPGFAVSTPRLWGDVQVVYAPLNKFYSKPYSRTSLKRMTALAPVTSNASVDLHRVSGDEVKRCHLEVHRAGDEHGYARLLVWLTPDADGQYSQRCPEIAFMRQYAQSHPVVFGHVSYMGESPGETDLEATLALRTPKALAQWQRYLRGYSWITVVPSVLANTLGGTAGLREREAFAEVAELPGGGVWLRATDSWSEYGDDQVEHVFRALAPVLPPGMPQRDTWAPQDRPGYLVSWRDAAEAG